MFARTHRLLLRPGWPEDAPALYAAINDEAIVRNLGRAPWPYALTDAQDFLDRQRPVTGPDFLIFRRTAGAPQLIGCIGISPEEDGTHEFGYWNMRWRRNIPEGQLVLWPSDRRSITIYEEK